MASRIRKTTSNTTPTGFAPHCPLCGALDPILHRLADEAARFLRWFDDGEREPLEVFLGRVGGPMLVIVVQGNPDESPQPHAPHEGWPDVDQMDLGDLTGTVVDGRWTWDERGEPYTGGGTPIVRIEAYSDPVAWAEMTLTAVC